MLLAQCLNIYELLDLPEFQSDELIRLFPKEIYPYIQCRQIEGSSSSSTFIRMTIPGKHGRSKQGKAPTIGLIGRLGGVGARPIVKGYVSDGDGALAVLAAALKIAQMSVTSDSLEGDVCIATQICENALVVERKPVPLMASPIDDQLIGNLETEDHADAYLSIDTSKGNRICNHNGFAITPTVKEGYLLKVSDDLLDLYSEVSGRLPVVLPITSQDITPYGNSVYHINSIMQPSVYTSAPVVGIAITSEVPVPGCATGASRFADIEASARYTVEAAKRFTSGTLSFFDEEEFSIIQSLYHSIFREKRIQSYEKKSEDRPNSTVS